MKYSKSLIPLLLLVLLTLPAWAQSTDTYELTRLIFGSSGIASGGQYEVAATLRQLDNAKLSGGDYSLEGGFVSGSKTTVSPETPQNRLYLPVILKK